MKGKKLVVEHLGGISARVLQEYPKAIQELIRRQSGLYALYRGNRLYYVGLASNLMARLKEHLADRHNGTWDRFGVYLTVHDEHMKELESLLLRIATPRGNKQGGRCMGSRNLRSTLNNRIREADSDKRAVLLGGPVAKRRRQSKARKGKGTRALAGLVERRLRLKGFYKGYEYSGTLRRDGHISYGGYLFETPSAAAKAIVKRSTNGWRFWQYRDPKGEWVPLARLKR